MRIADPIYDVVFKYLMEDRKSAVLLLPALLIIPKLRPGACLSVQMKERARIGMLWWTPENARFMLALRVDRADGYWNKYWDSIGRVA
jgi:hypothetical protein